MSIIHITDGQTDRILDDITSKNILSNIHLKSLKDTLETFDFTTFADKPFSQYLGKHNRVIIPSEDKGFIEFVILESGKVSGTNEAEVYTSASYLLLKKAKIIEPKTLSGQTTSTAVSHALGGTEWQSGIITAAGTRTFHIEEHTNPFNLLKLIAREFNLELNFRVEIDGNRIAGRYVDLLPRVGEWRGREVEFGRDLLGVKRVEKTDHIYTALLGLGPEREDGTRLEVLVEDAEALARWGRNGKHLIDTYEPQTADQDITLERLTALTKSELEKRVNAVVEYESDIADLENVPGMANKKIRFGDTIKIKDTKFNPPLYLEARVHTLERDIVNKSSKHVELGDFIEYTEDEVRAIWKSLQAEIKLKVSMLEVLDVTYTKLVIDSKDQSVYQEGTIYTDVRTEQAISHADFVAGEAKRNANLYTDEARDTLLQNLAYKADFDYVDGKLLLKANVDYVQGIQLIVEDHEDRIEQRVVKTEYAADQAGVVTRFENVETVQSQHANAINQRVTQSVYESGIHESKEYTDGKVAPITTRLTNAETAIDQNAAAILLRATKTDLNATNKTLSEAEARIEIQAGQILNRVEKNGIISSINQTPEDIKILANKINLVGAVTVLSNITGNLGTITAGTLKTVNLEGVTGSFSGDIVARSLYVSANDTTLTAMEMNWLNTHRIRFSVGDTPEPTMLLTARRNSNGANNENFNLDLRGSLTVARDIALSGTGQKQITGPTTVYRDNGNGILIVSAGNSGTSRSIYLRPNGNFNSAGEFFLSTDSLNYLNFQMRNVESLNHAFMRMGNVALKGLNSTVHKLQARNLADNGFVEMQADKFTDPSGAEAYINGSGGGTLSAGTTLKSGGIGSNATNFYIGQSGEARVTDQNGFNGGGTITYKPMRASSFPTGSSILYKDNIENLSEEQANYLLDNIVAKTYHLKSNLEVGIYDKVKIGIISEMTPKELRDENGVDPYSIVSLLIKTAQIQRKQIRDLSQRVSDLEMIA